MKHQLIAIIAITLLIINSSCEKQIPTALTGYFYTTDSSTSENDIKLWIDGVDKGYLPFINQVFTDSTKLDSSMQSKALSISIMSGDHLIQAKKSDGTVMASSKMYFKFYKHKTNSGIQSDTGAVGYKLMNNTQQVLIWISSQAK